MRNVAEQINQSVKQFKNIFGVEIIYNGQCITAIHDNEETNLRESGRGMVDKNYFSVFVEDIAKPTVNDEIIYANEKYRVIRILNSDGVVSQLDTERNTSVFMRR